MVICINGEDGSGKDTLAKLLFLRLNERESSLNVFDSLKDSIYRDTNEDWIIQHFGKAVADEYQKYSGVYWYDLDRSQKELHRYKFSVFAENMKTLFGLDVWSKRVDLTRNTIIPDLRFKVELSNIIEYPHYSIKVVKDNTTSLVNELKNYDKWDKIVHNNGSIEDLIKVSKTIYQEVKSRL